MKLLARNSRLLSQNLWLLMLPITFPLLLSQEEDRVLKKQFSLPWQKEARADGQLSVSVDLPMETILLSHSLNSEDNLTFPHWTGQLFLILLLKQSLKFWRMWDQISSPRNNPVAQLPLLLLNPCNLPLVTLPAISSSLSLETWLMKVKQLWLLMLQKLVAVPQVKASGVSRVRPTILCLERELRQMDSILPLTANKIPFHSAVISSDFFNSRSLMMLFARKTWFKRLTLLERAWKNKLRALSLRNLQLLELEVLVVASTLTLKMLKMLRGFRPISLKRVCLSSSTKEMVLPSSHLFFWIKDMSINSQLLSQDSEIKHVSSKNEISLI